MPPFKTPPAAAPENPAAAAPSQNAPRTGLGLRLAYGFGSVAYGVKDNGVAYLLLFYYDQVLGLPAGWIGMALFIALIADAFSDPAVGVISDRWRSRWGRRHPFMYAAALPVALSYLLLWRPPEFIVEGGPFNLWLWLLGSLILVRTLVTLYETPSSALISELTDQYDERTSMLSFRFFFGWSGGLTVAVLFYQVFAPAAGGLGEAAGYHIYGVTAACIMFVAILVSAGGTHHRIPYLRTPPVRRGGLIKTMRELRETFANRNFRVLFAGAVFYGGAAGVGTSFSIYISRYFYGFTSEEIAWLQYGYFFSAAGALALAPFLSKRFGKRRAAIGSALIAFTLLPGAVFAKNMGLLPPTGSDELFRLIFALTTLDICILISSTILISSMVADVVEESELQTGRRSEGTFFAARTFAMKAVGGLGVFIAGLLINALALPTGDAVEAVSEATVRQLGYAYCFGTGIPYLIAVAFYSRYRISRRSHEANLQKLKAAKEN